MNIVSLLKRLFKREPEVYLLKGPDIYQVIAEKIRTDKITCENIVIGHRVYNPDTNKLLSPDFLASGDYTMTRQELDEEEHDLKARK